MCTNPVDVNKLLTRFQRIFPPILFYLFMNIMAVMSSSPMGTVKELLLTYYNFQFPSSLKYVYNSQFTIKHLEYILQTITVTATKFTKLNGK